MKYLEPLYTKKGESKDFILVGHKNFIKQG